MVVRREAGGHALSADTETGCSIRDLHFRHSISFSCVAIKGQNILIQDGHAKLCTNLLSFLPLSPKPAAFIISPALKRSAPLEFCFVVFSIMDLCPCFARS